jgi:hypothetical protein
MRDLGQVPPKPACSWLEAEGHVNGSEAFAWRRVKGGVEPTTRLNVRTWVLAPPRMLEMPLSHACIAESLSCHSGGYDMSVCGIAITPRRRNAEAAEVTFCIQHMYMNPADTMVIAKGSMSDGEGSTCRAVIIACADSACAGLHCRRVEYR